MVGVSTNEQSLCPEVLKYSIAGQERGSVHNLGLVMDST